MSPHIRLLAAAAIAILVACSDGEPPEPPDGEIEGEVHLLGDLTQPPASGVVQLYATPSAVESRIALREAALAGGPTDWTYQLDKVAPGTYYIGACFAFGCGTFSDIEGHPAPVVVVADETTRAAMTF